MNPEEFDGELRAALKREMPSAGFAERVMARAAKPVPRKSPLLTWALAAGLAIGIAIPAGFYEQRRRHEAKAEVAAQQLLAALQITNSKMRHTRESVQRRMNRL